MGVLASVDACIFVTGTASAATATATLPASGAGLFHYVTSIHIARASTAVVAGTAVITITSTNLPGNPAWSVGNAIAAGGTLIDLDFTPAVPVKCSVANTATTIVYPSGGAGVTTRINVAYYVGP